MPYAGTMSNRQDFPSTTRSRVLSEEPHKTGCGFIFNVDNNLVEYSGGREGMQVLRGDTLLRLRTNPILVP